MGMPMKGYRSPRLPLAARGYPLCAPSRLRLLVLAAAVIFTCASSLFVFGVTWGDCLAVRAARPPPFATPPDPLKEPRSPRWDYFDHIYCLHSYAAVERTAEIHAAFKLLRLENDVEWWDATMDPEDGHRGAWNSHKSIAIHALKNNFSKIFVFEDDIRIEPFLERGVDNVMQRVVRFLSSTPTWEVFFFSHNCKRMELTADPDFVRVNSWGMLAYGLNKAALHKLAQSEFRETVTVDSIVFENKNAYAIYPMVIEHKPNLSYTIKSNRTEDVNKEWRFEENLLHEDAVVRNMYACSPPFKRAWGKLLYSRPRLNQWQLHQ